jgi:hypothetical protein
VVTWRLALQAAETASIRFGYRVDVAKGVQVIGWRE